jgi:RNA polymerase sigma-70 factor, ECF subfamily
MPEKRSAVKNMDLKELSARRRVSDHNLLGGSFEELAMPLFDSLYNFAHWLTRNREEAEDIVQETYAKALKGFHSFQPGTNFRAWMFRILQNTFLTSRTGLKASMHVSLDSDEDESLLSATTETPESLLMERLTQELVHRAIAELPLNFREVVLLCDVEGMSYQEIAHVLSIPIGTVMSRLARARNALRVGLTRKPRGSNNVSLVPGPESMPRFIMALSEDIIVRQRAEDTRLESEQG